MESSSICSGVMLETSPSTPSIEVEASRSDKVESGPPKPLASFSSLMHSPELRDPHTVELAVGQSRGFDGDCRLPACDRHRSTPRKGSLPPRARCIQRGVVHHANQREKILVCRGEATTFSNARRPRRGSCHTWPALAPVTMRAQARPSGASSPLR